MKLELEDRGQEISRVGHVARDMVLRARIEVGFAALCAGRDALILPAQLPPRLVVVRRLSLTGKHFPAPLIHQQPERQEGDLLECATHQQAEVGSGRWDCVEQPGPLQVFGSYRKRDRIADGFMETVVGAALKKQRESLVSALVEVVAEFVVDG